MQPSHSRARVLKTLCLMACFSMALSSISYGGIFKNNNVVKVSAETIGDSNVDGNFNIIDLLFLKTYAWYPNNDFRWT